MDNAQTTKTCPCTGNCGRHGNCAACVAYHQNQRTLTACMKIIAKEISEKAGNEK